MRSAPTRSAPSAIASCPRWLLSNLWGRRVRRGESTSGRSWSVEPDGNPTAFALLRTMRRSAAARSDLLRSVWDAGRDGGGRAARLPIRTTTGLPHRAPVQARPRDDRRRLVLILIVVAVIVGLCSLAVRGRRPRSVHRELLAKIRRTPGRRSDGFAARRTNSSQLFVRVDVPAQDASGSHTWHQGSGGPGHWLEWWQPPIARSVDRCPACPRRNGRM